MLSSAPLVIVAPNGARRTKTDHPALPMTPEELAQTAEACRLAGASMIHMHARKADGSHSLEIDDNYRTYQAVKERVGDQMMVQMTTEAVGLYQPDQQMSLIRTLKPEAASFGLRELIPTPEHEADARSFFEWVYSQGILAQYILYSADDLRYYQSLIDAGKLPSDQHHVLFVLGRYTAGQQSEPKDLDPFLTGLPSLKRRWAICAFGKREQECLLYAAEKGGDLRLGFENNLLNSEGELAQDNAEQVSKLVTKLRDKGHKPMSCKDFKHQV